MRISRLDGEREGGYPFRMDLLAAARREKSVARFIVFAALVWGAVILWPEIEIGRLDNHDGVLHLALIRSMATAVEAGANPLDHWMEEWSLGYPLARTYQPFGHLVVVGLYFALGKSVSLLTLFAVVRYLLLALVPLSAFAGARLMGFSPLTAAAAALLLPLVSGEQLMGVEDYSFIWGGFGLYSQLCALHLFLITIGLGSRAIRRGRGLTLTGVLLGLTFLTHMIYGYMAALTLVLLTLLSAADRPLRSRLFALTAIAGISISLTAFHLVTLIRDGQFINHSPSEAFWRWHSWGARNVLTWLATGRVLDHNQLPVLTLLAGAGCLLIMWRIHRQPATQRGPETFVLASAALWTLLWFGPLVWGWVLYRLLGLSEDVHLHRFVGSVQVFLVLVAAVALSFGWRWVGSRKRGPAIAACLTVVLLLPVFWKRYKMMQANAELGRAHLTEYFLEAEDFERAIEAAGAMPGRVYPGRSSNWGATFKVGVTPVYGHLARSGIPAVGQPLHRMALAYDVVLAFEEDRLDHYRLFDIGAVLAPADVRFARPLPPPSRFGRFRVYQTEGGGYFDLVRTAYRMQLDRTSFHEPVLAWLESDWVAHRQHFLIDYPRARAAEKHVGLPLLDPSDPLPRSRPASALGTTTDQPTGKFQTYAATADVKTDCWLLFKMSFHPNWRVRVDGEPVATAMLSPGLVGIPIAAGEHTIECRYVAEWWKPWLLALGVLVIVASFFVERRRRHDATN